MRSKGQVTIFMLLGIVLVIGALVFFYIRQDTTAQQLAPGLEIQVEQTPVEFDPVRLFTTSCIEDISEEGLRLIGKQGGYISLEPEYSGANFIINEDPTSSDAVEFAPGSGLKIPYWFYMQTANECEQCSYKSSKPPLTMEEGGNSIESQLAKYVDKNLDRCLSNFQPLKGQGFEITSEERKVEAKVTDSDVVVIVNQEITARLGGNENRLSQFYAVMPVSLKQIYALAGDITEKEAQHRYLEKAAINLIAAFAGVSKDRLPALGELRFQFGSTTNWVKEDVKQQVRQILQAYFDAFQVFGTRNFNSRFYTTSLQEALYTDFNIISDGRYPALEASFSYLDFWPVYFDLNCNGEFCEPESVTNDILPIDFGIQRYDFVYDVSFPAYVELSQPSAFDGRGYKFSFFLEGNLRNNEPLGNEIPFSSLSFETGSQLCNSENMNTEPVAINVADSVTGDKASNVQVAYSVAGETCFIGSTNESGTLAAKFPGGAVGGVLQLRGQDYLSKSVPFEPSAEKTVNERIGKIKEMKFIVQKKKLSKGGDAWILNNNPVSLNADEAATVIVRRLGSLEEQEHQDAATYSQSQPSASAIRLAPGDYELQVIVTSPDGINIPERKKKIESFFDEKTVTIPGLSILSGQEYIFAGFNSKISVSAADLSKNELIFYAVEPSIRDIPEGARTMEDFNEISNIEYYSGVYKQSLRPKFQ
ncbi:hypothetical protein J4212_00025 [Candidatus Woesearchaeota archaeon]|nr:hypothetical protein [Candidatus Woesearchaeota archaeon]